jgi:TolA-binding protein
MRSRWPLQYLSDFTKESQPSSFPPPSTPQHHLFTLLAPYRHVPYLTQAHGTSFQSLRALLQQMHMHLHRGKHMQAEQQQTTQQEEREEDQQKDASRQQSPEADKDKDGDQQMGHSQAERMTSMSPAGGPASIPLHACAGCAGRQWDDKQKKLLLRSLNEVSFATDLLDLLRVPSETSAAEDIDPAAELQRAFDFVVHNRPPVQDQEEEVPATPDTHTHTLTQTIQRVPPPLPPPLQHLPPFPLLPVQASRTPTLPPAPLISVHSWIVSSQ